MLEAEEAVGVAGRRGAVVEAADGEAVEARLDVESAQGGADGAEGEVAQLNARADRPRRLVLADQGYALGCDPGQVVVEGRGRLRRREGGGAGARGPPQGPGAGPAALHRTREDDGLPRRRGASDAPRGDSRRRGHDEFDAVLDRPRGVEDEDILRAGA